MKLIDKDAALAVIENIKEGLQRNCNPNPLGNLQECLAAAEIETLNLVVDLVNTLEVKEVDLDFLIHEEYAAAAKTEYDCIERATFTKFEFTQLVKHIFELGLKTQKGEQVDYGKLKTSLDNALAKETKESWEKFLKEDSVSEDLNTAAKVYADNITDKIGYKLQLRRAVVYGANLQKEQFEKNRLEHCNSITNEQAELEQGFIDQHLDKHQRMPTFLDAIEYGMRLQKEQMMAKAIKTEASFTMSVPCICISLPRGVNVGDKVKVIVIKEN